MPTAGNEVVELLQQMIRNRCVNDGSVDSGHEHRNTDLLADFLEGSGIAMERHESAPGRDNLVARIEGSDRAAPTLLLLGHTDVVPANPDRWRHDPYGGEIIDGEIWGRGAIDMLNLTSSMAATVRDLATSGHRPKGSIVYAAVADEEAGGIYGADHLVRTLGDAVQADYVITETGGFPLPAPEGTKLPIVVAEKGTQWCTLKITGTPGHGSMPYRTDNALTKAAEVVHRLASFTPPTRIQDEWRAFVGALGLPEEMSAPLLDEARFVDACEMLPLGISRMAHACAHTTITPTVIESGGKLNVIPDTVQVQVDVRTIPGDGRAEVRAMFDEALGDLAGDVEIDWGVDNPATRSPTDTPLWDALERVARTFYADASLVPMLMPGATDARFFRRAGSVAYGFGIFSRKIGIDELASMAHGDDERIDVDSLEMVTRMWDVLIRDLG